MPTRKASAAGTISSCMCVNVLIILCHNFVFPHIYKISILKYKINLPQLVIISSLERNTD